MKRFLGVILCLTLLLGCVVPVLAANDVPQEVVEAAKSVVRIVSLYSDGIATGSGFVIKNEPGELLIATNNHVVEDNPTSISVWVAEDELAEAEVVFATAKKDLCVLRIRETVDMPALTLAEEAPRQGQAVYAVGYPGVGDILSDSVAHTGEAATITDGIISAIRTLTIEEGADPAKLLQINAAINSGNSGGPLFNTKGEVIGVNTYGVGAQGIFGAVDISELRTLLEQNHIEISGKTAKSGWPSLPVAIALGGAVILAVVVVILIRGKKKKQPRRKQAVTLREYLQAHPQGIGVGGAVSLLLPMAIQLRNLHNDGRLHLEICPENILVGSNGASLKNPSGQEAGRYNSGFAAPEIYKGAGFGITSDIYSFGAVLYFAATGKVPVNSLQQDMLEADLDRLDNAAFGDLLRKAMTPGVQDRTQSMQELIYSMAAFNIPEEATVQPGNVPIPEPIEMAAAEPVKLKPSVKKASPMSEKTKKRLLFLVPIGVVLACACFGAGMLLWRLAAKENLPRIAATQETLAPIETTNPSTSEEAAYAQAETFLTDGETAKAAIAFGKLGDYRDSRERSFAIWEEIADRETIGAGNEYIVGLQSDGTVTMLECNEDSQPDLGGWQDITAISAGHAHTVGLKADGTVVAVGPNKYGECDVSSWQNITAISAGYYHTVGLKIDGTVVAVGQNKDGQCDVSGWEDIVAVSAGYYHTVGLKADGTVVTAGRNQYGQCDIGSWTDITAIAAGYAHTVGVRSNGTAVAAGWNEYGQCGVGGWRDIVAISASTSHTLGLKSNGTVVVAGWNSYGHGKDNVKGWTNIVAVSAGQNLAVGLKPNGTVVVTDEISDKDYNVRNWTIKLPNY